MARINIEDELSFDPRFQAVIQSLGNQDTAIGMAYRLFRLAQRYWGDDRNLIPNEIFDMHGLEIFLKVGLARREEEGIYVCGTKDHLEWYAERKDAARVGGQKSAEARKEKFGSADPRKNVKQTGSKASQNMKQMGTNGNPLPLALSPALSLSLALNRGKSARVDRASPNRKKNIHRLVTLTVAMLRRIDDEVKARGEYPSVAWRVLETYFPDNTWDNWRASLRQHIDRKAEKYFRLDLEKHFDSFLPDNEQD